MEAACWAAAVTKAEAAAVGSQVVEKAEGAPKARAKAPSVLDVEEAKVERMVGVATAAEVVVATAAMVATAATAATAAAMAVRQPGVCSRKLRQTTAGAERAVSAGRGRRSKAQGA